MAREIDSDRDDITVDTSREALVRRVVAMVAAEVVRDLGWVDMEELGEPSPPPPAPEAIERAVRAYNSKAGLALRVARGILWPLWSHDAGSEEPADLEALTIARVRRICGLDRAD